MRRAIIRLSDGLDRGMVVLNVFALAVLVGVVFLQVIARYIFSSPPSWTEELARYAMIWAGLLGATMSFKRRFDPALFQQPEPSSYLLGVLGGLLRSAVILIYLLPVLFFCFVGANMSLQRGFLLRHSRMMTDGLGVTSFWVAIAVPIMIIVVLVHLASRWCDGQETKRRDESPPSDTGLKSTSTSEHPKEI